MKAKVYLLSILSLLTLTASADYVDDINNATVKNEAGRRVIYEMNIGMFTTEGTFAAAQQKLGELKQLGVDIVWLMPIYPRGSSNSPYAPTDYQKTNPKYGSVADLKNFVTAAHNLQMEVWLDWVPNHTAVEADWVTSHPEYYGWNGNQDFRHPYSGSITYNDVWQLNYYSNDLKKAMNDALKFWIDQTDIDGYRCDYVSSPQIPADYWTEAIPLIKNYKPGKTITFLGEVDIAQDVTKLKTVGFDYDYAWGYQSSLATYGPSSVNAAPLKANANTMLTASNGVSFGRMLYVTNHDQNWNESKQTLTQKYGDNRYPLTVLVGTLYGMPLIYNGQETGGNQILNYFEDTKINWNTKDNKMRNTLRTLTALKHAVPALSDKVAPEWVNVSAGSANVLAFTRKSGNSEVLVVLNMAASTTNATLTGLSAGTWSQWLTSETIAQGISRKQQTFTATQSFTLEAKGYRIFVKGEYSEEEVPAPEVYTPTLESANEMALFFETAEEANYQIWAWGNNLTENEHLGLAKGKGWTDRPFMTQMGQAANGNYIYKFVFCGSVAPTNFIITKNGDDPRPHDGTAYVVNGYYVESNTKPEKTISEVTGINAISTKARPADGRIYALGGQQIKDKNSLRSGIYIQNGKKFIVK